MKAPIHDKEHSISPPPFARREFLTAVLGFLPSAFPGIRTLGLQVPSVAGKPVEQPVPAGQPTVKSKAVPGTRGHIAFEDLIETSGIRFQLKNSVSPQRYSIETMLGGVAVFDYNNGGLLDIFFTNGAAIPSLDKSDPSFYNRLYRNNGDGTFTDVSVEMGIAQHAGKGMAVTFADYDGDGYLDAFVTNDTTPNFLFHNLHGKRFEEVGAQAGVAYSADGGALSSMGADFRDINNDGRPDIWYTAVDREGFPLNLGTGKGDFVDMTVANGLATTTDMSGWGNGMADFDNDGWKDLFVARANVMDNIGEVNLARHYPEPNTIFRNLGQGKFRDVSATAGPDFQKEAAHRGVAFGDLDNNGRIDMVVSVLNGPAELFHNISETGNHWILLKLTGAKSNRMGIGAQVKLTAQDGSVQWNEATTAVGYASSSDPRVHFGLGKNQTIKEIEIRWPSGIRQVLRDQAVDRILPIEEPDK